MKLIYLSAASIAMTAIVAVSHAQSFHSNSMCLITESASLYQTVGPATEAAYNFVESDLDHTVN